MLFTNVFPAGNGELLVQKYRHFWQRLKRVTTEQFILVLTKRFLYFEINENSNCSYFIYSVLKSLH